MESIEQTQDTDTAEEQPVAESEEQGLGDDQESEESGFDSAADSEDEESGEDAAE